MPSGPTTDHGPDEASAGTVADGEIRALATEWLTQLDRLADGMYAHLRDRIPVLDEHPSSAA